MNFEPSAEQQLVAASVARFVEREYSFSTRRAIVASADGYDQRVWQTMAEIGLLSLALPTAYGGLGGGAVEAMSVMEAIGDALIVEPWLATVALGAQLVARGGSEAQRQQLLPAVGQGLRKLAFAHAEPGSRYALAHVATRATRDDGGYLIAGMKQAVAHAAAAGEMVVSARTEGADTDAEGIALFLVPTDAAGLSLRPLRMLDGTRAADVVLDGVHVPTDAIVGPPARALPLIEDVVDFATALVCAEAVGAIKSANDATLDYLKTRKQFGVAIGSFQALQHRMVDMVIEHEQAKSMATLACSTVDHERDRLERSRIVAAAKVRIADACRRVSQESIQLHGGMGMSDELKISHTFRRLTAIAQQFGDADHHLERFARLSDRRGGRA